MPSDDPPPQTPNNERIFSGATSRVTVVCAECKRLKLKCDRRTPCGACQKRNQIEKCIYRPDAQNKVSHVTPHSRRISDVQLLHNRLCIVEDQLANQTSSLHSSVHLSNSTLATGPSNSSIILSLDEVSTSWLSDPYALDFHVLYPSVDLPPCSDPVPPPYEAFLQAPSASATNQLPCVTPSLLAYLPSDTTARDELLYQFQAVMRLHPAFNIPQFAMRVNELFNPPSPSASPPSLSFFAVVSAAFSLASQAYPSISPSTSSTFLHTLSVHSLLHHESHFPYDLDYIHAMILHTLFLLNDTQKGPHLAKTLFSNVGKLVNIARYMGLHRDPDAFSGKFTVWETEMRRRCWWNVVFYDFYISDLMGHDALILEGSYSCRIPEDVDESAFNPGSSNVPSPREDSNFSYFIEKMKLLQLLRSIKTRLPTSSQDSTSRPLETVALLELEITTHLSSLPPNLRLPSPSATSTVDFPTIAPHVLAQRYELLTLAHSQILKLFRPFMKSSPASVVISPSFNSAHSIIHFSNILLKHTKIHPPSASFPNYSFAKNVYIAGITLAQICITSPSFIFVDLAMEDLKKCLEMMKACKDGVGENDAVKVISGLRALAEAKLVGGVVAEAGVKRKHAEIADPGAGNMAAISSSDITSILPHGCLMPYVGASLITAPTTSAFYPEEYEPSSGDQSRSRSRHASAVRRRGAAPGPSKSTPGGSAGGSGGGGGHRRTGSSPSPSHKGGVSQIARRPSIGVRIRTEGDSPIEEMLARPRAKTTAPSTGAGVVKRGGSVGRGHSRTSSGGISQQSRQQQKAQRTPAGIQTSTSQQHLADALFTALGDPYQKSSSPSKLNMNTTVDPSQISLDMFPPLNVSPQRYSTHGLFHESYDGSSAPDGTAAASAIDQFGFLYNNPPPGGSNPSASAAQGFGDVTMSGLGLGYSPELGGAPTGGDMSLFTGGQQQIIVPSQSQNQSQVPAGWAQDAADPGPSFASHWMGQGGGAYGGGSGSGGGGGSGSGGY